MVVKVKPASKINVGDLVYQLRTVVSILTEADKITLGYEDGSSDRHAPDDGIGVGDPTSAT